MLLVLTRLTLVVMLWLWLLAGLLLMLLVPPRLVSWLRAR